MLPKSNTANLVLLTLPNTANIVPNRLYLGDYFVTDCCQSGYGKSSDRLFCGKKRAMLQKMDMETVQ